MATRQAMGAMGLRWLAKVWNALPTGTQRRERDWFNELSEDVIALAPLLLRLVRNHPHTQSVEGYRLFEQFLAIEGRLETGAERGVLPQATVTMLIAESQALWQTIWPYRLSRKKR